MDLFQKVEILGAAAKFDASCASSGSRREARRGGLGAAALPGICHSWSDDGRCISLLKILQSNACVYDCAYCANRASGNAPRATLTPEELAELTVNFYRRNYIEGLFLSSGVVGTPDATMENMLRAITLLRETYSFGGYIHAKAIPGASPELVSRLGRLVDRMSVNIELPSEAGLRRLAPAKTRESILGPMGFLTEHIREAEAERALSRRAPVFVPAGQSTQLIVGATEDSDLQILRLAQGLYRRYALRRVYYSAYVPVGTDPRLPALVAPPLCREHRTYQADWLLRHYGFTAEELLDDEHPSFESDLDPKAAWALRHLDLFPVEANTASLALLLRVPGVGVKSAKRIVAARRDHRLDDQALTRLGVVMKRARYFLLANGRYCGYGALDPAFLRGRIGDAGGTSPGRQLSLFAENPGPESRISPLGALLPESAPVAAVAGGV